MTPRAYIMRFGCIVLSVATLVVIGASVSDDVWSQIGKFAARDPGVRWVPVAADGIFPAYPPEERAFADGRAPFQEVESVQGVVP